MSDHPGRVVTVEVLASLVSEAYAGSFTPVNIMKGFKKTGIWPINPGEVTDRQIIPSKALSSKKTPEPSNPTTHDTEINKVHFFPQNWRSCIKRGLRRSMICKTQFILPG